MKIVVMVTCCMFLAFGVVGCAVCGAVVAGSMGFVTFGTLAYILAMVCVCEIADWCY